MYASTQGKTAALQQAVGSYHRLHDELAMELEALLQEEDEGNGVLTPEQADHIAGLAFALQSLGKLTNLEDKNHALSTLTDSTPRHQ
jgi:hypothetical protein